MAALIEGLSESDEDLGRWLLTLAVAYQAEKLGAVASDECAQPIAADLMASDEFVYSILSHLRRSEAGNARTAALEKAIHKAATGDFATAGRFLREHLRDMAVGLKFIPIGIQKSAQAREFGSRGAEQNRLIGEENRRAILAERERILAIRKSRNPPSRRSLARTISDALGMSFDTVLGHLKKL